ncbi:CASP-like protein 1 [Rhododendron vialii]|uniref:CASP-like protein 1 n=1 Tax=Rhododendron vialii TaxID=182163 RepID=UPI00265FBAB7|nr:CASP-like protein 1 [Rhododendron vialii]
MASTDYAVPPELEKEAPPREPTAPDVEKAAPPPPTRDAPLHARQDYFRVADVVLRLLLFAVALVAVVVMVTSKETRPVGRKTTPPYVVFKSAKFQDSPAFIYFVAALSVAGLYAIITTLVSFLALLKPSCSTKLLPHFVIFDVLLLGIVAAATGAAGGVAYVGIKGNSHTEWKKVCSVFGRFCAHVESAIAVSIFASILLANLVILSAHSLSKKIPK